VEGLLGDASGLSRRAKADIMSGMATGGGDWASQLSERRTLRRAPTSSASRTIAPRVGRGGAGAPAPGAALNAAPTRTTIRTRDAIAESTGNYEREAFPGAPPGPSRDAEKQRLAEVFEWGRAGAQRIQEARRMAGRAPPPPAAADADPREAMVDQMVEEVRERREFLEEMQARGRGAEFRHVQGEISQRLGELARLGY